MQKPCPLEEGHNVDSFDCQKEELNFYLKNHALQSQRSYGTVTYVSIDEKLQRVAGYYTLLFGSIAYDDAPQRVKQGLARPSIPILLLARLAIDKEYQGKGLGSALLLDSLKKAIIASRIAGLRTVIVDAKDAEAKAFYEHFNFEAMPSKEQRLCLLMKDLLRLFQGQDIY